MKVVKKFYNTQTGEKLIYTDKDRTQTILHDWSVRNKENDIRRYKRYLREFNLYKKDFKDKVVVDIGCGAWGGVLRLMDNAKTIAVDPLITEFIKYQLFDYNGDFLIDDGKHIRLPKDYADYVFCLNTLDHCDNTITPSLIVKEIYRILKPNCRTYIYVHLRGDDNLNIMHLYALERKDLIRWFRPFKTISFSIEMEDTVWDTGHKVFWGVFEKNENINLPNS
jgi:SAM-dependent methyltransferase